MLEMREHIVREKWIDIETAKIIGEKLRWCYRIEGVNHLHKCKARARRSLEHSSTTLILTRVRHPPHQVSSAPRTNDYDSKLYHHRDEESSTVSKEQPRHQELSFSARRRGSPFLGLGAPGFTFINKLLKESISFTLAEEHMANLTSNELVEAIWLYRQEQARIQEESKLQEEPEDSGDSQQSKRSIFDHIGAKVKKNKKDQGNKKEIEATK
ncbi:hypothetical protein AgCh_011949 [Apium graveolens]